MYAAQAGPGISSNSPVSNSSLQVGARYTTAQLLYGFWGFKLRLSGLQNNHLTYWDITQILRSAFKFRFYLHLLLHLLLFILGACAHVPMVHGASQRITRGSLVSPTTGMPEIEGEQALSISPVHHIRLKSTDNYGVEWRWLVHSYANFNAIQHYTWNT